MKANLNEVEINGEVYVKKGENTTRTTMRDFFIIRTYSAGVFAGNIKSRNGKEGVLENSIRLWAWAGAAALDQLATEGTKEPEKCKFTVEVPIREVTEIIEVIPCTEAAYRSITGVKTWKK